MQLPRTSSGASSATALCSALSRRGRSLCLPATNQTARNAIEGPAKAKPR